MEKITIELTRDEALMLQELSEDADCGCDWMQEIADSLHKKAVSAYKKPVMSAEEYRTYIEQIRSKWRGTVIERLMVEAEVIRIRFFYRLEQDDETT